MLVVRPPHPSAQFAQMIYSAVCLMLCCQGFFALINLFVQLLEEQKLPGRSTGTLATLASV